MHLVEVDHVDPEPPQRGVAGRADAVRRQPLTAGVRDREAHLVATTTSSRCRASHGASVRSELAVAVDVGGVDQRAARLQEAVEHAVGLVHRRVAAMSMAPSARRLTVSGPSEAVCIPLGSQPVRRVCVYAGSNPGSHPAYAERRPRSRA